LEDKTLANPPVSPIFVSYIIDIIIYYALV